MSNRPPSPASDRPAYASPEDPDSQLPPFHRSVVRPNGSRPPAHLLSLVPKARLSQEARRSGGQGQAEGEAQDSVDRAEEIQAAPDLCFQLGREEGGGAVCSTELGVRVVWGKERAET